MSKISAELRKVYEDTDYKVFFDQKEIILKVGKESIEMNQILDDLRVNNFAFITAANPNSSLKPIEENRIRNLELEKFLIQKEILYCKGIGESGDNTWKEESFCAFGIDLQIAKKLAKAFEQNAFVFGMENGVPKIVYCI